MLVGVVEVGTRRCGERDSLGHASLEAHPAHFELRARDAPLERVERARRRVRRSARGGHQSAVARERGSGRLSARLRKGAVIRCQRTNGQATKYHPTQKPVDVLRQLIESSSLLGELVLDPFMGVGSTLVAAIAEERRAIGIEVEEKYCERAAERCRAATDARAQGVLMLRGDA